MISRILETSGGGFDSMFFSKRYEEQAENLIVVKDARYPSGYRATGVLPGHSIYVEYEEGKVWISQLNLHSTTYSGSTDSIVRFKIEAESESLIKQFMSEVRESYFEFSFRDEENKTYTIYPGDTYEDRPSEKDSFIPVDLKSVFDEFVKFPNNKEKYEKRGVRWKRSYFLAGPPGNGKSTFIRTLMSNSDQYNSIVFIQPMEYASQYASVFNEVIPNLEKPLLVVMEEISRQVTQENTSVLLNFLDGINQDGYSGVFIIATDNHPENLDDALVKRPGRFDRVICVENPTDEEVDRFVEKINLKCEIIDIDPSRFYGMSYAEIREVMSITTIKSINEDREVGMYDIEESISQLFDYAKKS